VLRQELEHELVLGLAQELELELELERVLVLALELEKEPRELAQVQDLAQEPEQGKQASKQTNKLCRQSMLELGLGLGLGLELALGTGIGAGTSQSAGRGILVAIQQHESSF
jgi:hypothetical protein